MAEIFDAWYEDWQEDFEPTYEEEAWAAYDTLAALFGLPGHEQALALKAVANALQFMPTQLHDISDVMYASLYVDAKEQADEVFGR